MSRRKNKTTQRVAVPIERLDAIVERTRSEPLPEDEHAILKAAVDTLARVTEELEAKTTTLQRVRHLIFGPRTETTEANRGLKPSLPRRHATIVRRLRGAPVAFTAAYELAWTRGA